MESVQELACFGGGCFWCTEAVYKNVRGVKEVLPGYIGGRTENPGYREVCAGTTGHAEAVQIAFNPKEVDYTALLEIFFATHDPTTPDRQGNDVGSQYRSCIFYTNDAQRLSARKFMESLEKKGEFTSSIVTELSAYEKFYPAEKYHHNYYTQNSNQPYCMYVIAPKLKKFLEKYRDLSHHG